jgi:hypothetical protein
MKGRAMQAVDDVGERYQPFAWHESRRRTHFALLALPIKNQEDLASTMPFPMD